MVVVVEVVDIDFTCDRVAVDLARFEMARDKLTKKSLTWKKSDANPNFLWFWWRGERVRRLQSANSEAATSETNQVRKSSLEHLPGMMYGGKSKKIRELRSDFWCRIGEVGALHTLGSVSPKKEVPRIEEAMDSVTSKLRWRRMLGLISLMFLALGTAKIAVGQNEVMGELIFEGQTNLERDSGVWIDGNYVGYLKELKGSKKIMLLPGEHQVIVRQSGYDDYVQKVVVEPGGKRLISVTLRLSPRATSPDITATLKLKIKPKRAAVFLDEKYVGHAGEFGGAFRSMKISPGKHRIRVELPGYRTFDTEVNLLADQETEVKTELRVGSIEQNTPLIKKPDEKQ